MRDFIGSFQLARKIFESDIFYNKPDKWFKIWVFILGICNHKDNKQFKRGECFTTYAEISEYTKAKCTSIDHCIRWLKSAKQIATRKATRGFYINVLNYDYYQDFNNYKRIKSDTESEDKSEIEAKQKRNRSDTIIKNGNNDNNDKKRENKFSPPSLKDIKDYCEERKNNVDPDNFINFYESKGWLIGKNKMKDWRAAVRTWENRNKGEVKVGEEKAIIPAYAKGWAK